jgi:hypothetical protein
MTSATVAVTLARTGRAEGGGDGFSIVTLIFIYTTGVNIWEKPDGIRIATLFILAIVAVPSRAGCTERWSYGYRTSN